MAPIVYSPIEERSLEGVSGYLQNHLATKPNYIQASPYTEESHLLDLNTLTTPHRLMAQALTIMKPLSEKYATTAYKEAFNWQEVVDRLRKQAEAEGNDYVFPANNFYIIVFHSRIKPDANWPILEELDMVAHREAVASGWLLKYWFGAPDAEGYNLATCIWRHIGDARKGGSGKGHIKAMGQVKSFYRMWEVERLSLVIGEGAKQWDIVNWVAEKTVEGETR